MMMWIMKETEKKYNPREIPPESRSNSEEIERYLTLKGLKCVQIMETNVHKGREVEHEFSVGRYYTTRGESKSSSPYLLPDFLKILDDENLQFEFYSLKSQKNLEEFSICHRTLDKKVFRKKDTFFHNYRGLLDHIPFLPEGECITVLRKLPPLKKDYIVEPEQTYRFGNENFTEQEFQIIMNEVNAQNHKILDDSIMQLLFKKKTEYQHDNLKPEDRNRIPESRVQALYGINPNLFKDYYLLLKIRDAFFDLSEFTTWINNWVGGAELVTD